MKRKGSVFISLPRTAEIFEEMLSVRRDFRADHEFFNAAELWEYLCEGDCGFAVRTFRSPDEDYSVKTGVICFEDKALLTVDQRLWNEAKAGGALANFILAHELGHLALNHHARGAVVKNFQLATGPRGNCNSPPTVEELEANYAAVFLQCGVALADPRWDPSLLAKRAFSDLGYVKKLSGLLRHEAFRKYLARVKPVRPRVIL